MQISAKEERKFRAETLALGSARHSIKLSKQHLTALSRGNEPDEQEEQKEQIDPTKFLNKKEIQKWNQLPHSQKKRYIADGIKISEKSLKSRNRFPNERIRFTEEIERNVASIYTTDLYHAEDASWLNTYSNSIRDRKKFFQNRWKQNQNRNSDFLNSEAEKDVDDKNAIVDQRVINGGEEYRSLDHGQNIVQVKSEMGSHRIAETAITNSANMTNVAASSVATTGVGVVAMAGKKAADKFKFYMQEQAMASEQAVRNVESKMMEIQNTNHEMDTLPTSIKYIGASAGAVLLSILAIVIQAAFSILTVLIGIVIAIVIPVIAVITIISAIISIIATLINTPVIAGGGERIVQIALQEENNTSGEKYWKYVMGSQFVNGDVTPWCACFVSWCANEAGLIDSGIVPKAAAVRAYHKFYADKGRFHYATESYTPQPGDFIVFGSDEHIGIVQYVEDERVVTIEGNTSDAVHSRSYPIGSSYITGYCNPEYPAGTTIEIPEGMGTSHTFMGWSCVTSRTSLQYQLRERSGEHYDSEGFAIIDGRYVIACTTLYGQVGDYVDFYRENGDVLHCVIGDIKNQNDSGCNQYGHKNGQCVVEFVVQYSMWYPSHANPGTASCHPEWNSRVVKAVNLGYNYLQ